MNLKSKEDIQTWMNNNLVNIELGREITEQSGPAFRQSVMRGKIPIFFEIEGNTSTSVKLFLRSDLEEYQKNKKEYNERNKKAQS